MMPPKVSSITEVQFQGSASITIDCDIGARAFWRRTSTTPSRFQSNIIVGIDYFDIPHDATSQEFPSLPRMGALSEDIAQIYITVFLQNECNAWSNAFSTDMVRYRLMSFLKVDAGSLVFLYTASTSQKIFAGPAIGIPNIRSLYLNDTTCSQTVYNAINSLANVLHSTLFCLLLYHQIGTMFRKMRILVFDLLVIILPAWSASAKQLVCTGLGGAFGGKFSFASGSTS